MQQTVKKGFIIQVNYISTPPNPGGNRLLKNSHHLNKIYFPIAAIKLRKNKKIAIY